MHSIARQKVADKFNLLPLAADFLVTTKYLDITLPFHLVQKLFSLTILTVDPCDDFHKDCRYYPSGQVAEALAVMSAVIRSTRIVCQHN